MARRVLVPVTYDGTGLNSLGRTAYLNFGEGGYSSPRHNAVSVEKQGAFPSFLRLQPEGKTFPLRFAIKSSATQEQHRAISKIFDPTKGTGILILEDRNCSPVQQYRVTCAPQQIITENPNDRELIVPLWCPDPILLDVDETLVTDTIIAAGNPILLTLTNEGTYPARPALLLSPPSSNKLPAQGYTEMNEIAYANRSEFSLTGPGSGKWMLQIISGWNTAAAITAGDMESDGRDIAVFVDEVQVPPEKVSIDGIDTANTKIWIEISDGPAVWGELATAITTPSTQFVFKRKDHGIRVGDFLAWTDSGFNVEQARVISVSGETVGVLRGVRNSDATGGVPGSSPVGTKIYRSGHHIQMAWNYIGVLPARPTDPDPPLIDLPTSSNTVWNWPTTPMWTESLQAGAWRRILYNGRDDVPELRKNRLGSRTTLASALGLVNRWTDEEPTPSAPNFDALEFTACCGIDDSLGAIEYDVALGWPFAFQIIGRDTLGYDSIMFSRLEHEVGAAHFPPGAYTNQQETPGDFLSAVTFRARNMIVTTARPGDAFEDTLAQQLAVGEDAQKFSLDEETQIVGVVIRVKDVADTAGGVTLVISEVADETIGIVQVTGGPGPIVVGPFSGANPVGAAYQQICMFPSLAAAFTTEIPSLSAGEYFLGIYAVSGTGNFKIPTSSTSSIYAKGEHWVRAGLGAWERDPDADIWFALLSLNTDNQEEMLNLASTGEVLDLSATTITFDDTTPRTPLIRAHLPEAAYHYDTTFTMNGDTIRFRYLNGFPRVANIIISPYEETVIDYQYGLPIENQENIRQTIEVIEDPWMEAIPGDNILSISAENGAEGEIHVAAFRHAWLA